MKEKKVEQVTYKMVYVSVDGTEFDDKDECLKYDKSALGILKGRIKEMSLSELSEDDLFHTGSCDNMVYACIPKSNEDIDTIKRLLSLLGNNEERISRLKYDQVGKIVFVYLGYADDWAWFRTLDDMIDTGTESKYSIELKEK